MGHPRHQLDEAFQTPVRLSLMAVLGADKELDFRTLREQLEVSDSALSKAVSHLERLEYVKTEKGYVGTRPRTWVSSTVKGRRAYRGHLKALRAIIAAAGEP